MTKLETLRAVVSARLTAAAEDIFALLEKTIAEFEEENQRKQRLLDTVLRPRVLLPRVDQNLSPGPGVQVTLLSSGLGLSPGLGLKQEIPESPQVKEEPQEQSKVKQEEEQLPVPVPDMDDDGNWARPLSCSTAQMETEAGGDKVQTRDRNTVEQTPALSYSYQCEPENTGLTSGTETHIRTHTGERPYSCSICKNSFVTKGNLDFHMKIHTDGKPFICSICDKKLASKYSLKAHFATHGKECGRDSAEKLYQCSICKKKFSYKGSLKIHKLIHSGERPYSCSICKKAFTRKHHLDDHAKTHTGERPFSCSICNRTFAWKCNLKTHMVSHTEDSD